MSQLSNLAGKYDIAIVGVEHPPKSSNGRAMNQVGGSIAFVAASRSAYLVSKDPEDEERRLFLKIKNNLSNYSGGISFTVESHKLPNGIEISKVVWGDEPVTITADEVLSYYNQTEFQHKKELRVKWVKGELADGPKNAAEVKKKAITQGMTEKEFRNAKKDAGVSSNKTDFDGGWDLSLSNPSHVP